MSLFRIIHHSHIFPIFRQTWPFFFRVFLTVKSVLLSFCISCLFHKTYGILTLENIYKFKVALFTHKMINNTTNIPNIFKGTLTLASEVHSYNTRFVSNLNFHRPRIMNNYGAATLAFAGSKIWEKIPTKLKKLSYNSFYKQYKLYLLNAQ